MSGPAVPPESLSCRSFVTGGTGTVVSLRRRVAPAIGLLLLSLGAATGLPARQVTEGDSLRAELARVAGAGDAVALGEAHNAYGIYLWEQAQYDSAAAHLNEARALWSEVPDSARMGRAYNSLGAVHFQWGNLGAAFESFMRSLEVRRAIGDTRGVALALTNVGLTYREWQQLDRARDALDEAVQEADRAGSPFVQGYARQVQGLVRLAAGDTEGARQAFEASMAIYLDTASGLGENERRSGWGLNQHGLARVLLAEGDAQGAVAILVELFGGSGENARTGRQAQALMHLAMAYEATGEHERAGRLLRRSLELSEEAGQRPQALEALAALATFHEERGEPGTALGYLRRLVALRDSLATQSGAQQIAAMEMRFEGERQARENMSLRETRRVQQEVIARQRLAFWLGGGLLVVSLALAGVLVRLNRQGQRHRANLASANESLEGANQELREALSQVRTLEGLIPICARCKKVRDDEGFWESVESYVSSRSHASFSHGICDECGPELYGEDWGKEKPGAQDASPPAGALPSTPDRSGV